MSDFLLIAKLDNLINNVIQKLSSKNIYSYRLGLARSVLAMSTFLTMVFNDPMVLFKNGNVFNANNFDSELYLFQKINFFSLFGAEHLILAKYIAILILLVVILGYRPRFTCIIHFWICISFNYATVLIEGGDQIASNLCLMLIPICLLDNRKWHWQPISEIVTETKLEKNLIANFFHLIIKLQMCLIYFHAAIGKIPNKDWANGTAVYYWFNDPTFGMSDWMHIFLDPILSNPFGVAFLTWGTILLETLLFMSIVMSKQEKWVLFIIGLLFHLGIIIIHGLFSFFFSMAAGLMLYIYVDSNYGKISFFERISKNYV